MKSAKKKKRKSTESPSGVAPWKTGPSGPLAGPGNPTAHRVDRGLCLAYPNVEDGAIPPKAVLPAAILAVKPLVP